MDIAALYAIYRQHPVVVTDTRQLTPGAIYMALKGPNFNGNHFAQQALEAGAAYAVVDEEAYATTDKTILVPDGLKALQHLALHHRQQLSIPFLAITGSNGKTTTKELVHAVLSTTFTTATTVGNLNNHIGVPLTILKIGTDAQLAVIEMGANHQKEIESYCTIALPTHGLITNCGKAHLEGFGGEAGVRKGKGELFDYLRTAAGAAFVMTDYDYLRPMSSGIATVYTYGTQTGDVTGVATQSDPFLSVAFTAGLQGNVSTALVGDYNLPNVLAAAAVGTAFGVDTEKIKTALEGYQPSNSRSQMVERGGRKIILDAYNANPSSMKLAIANFAKAVGRNKILVLGAMAELGEESEAEHRQIVEQIKGHSWRAVLLVGGDFLKLAHPFLSFTTAAEAGQWLKAHAAPDAFLLVKGSRSMQMEKALSQL